MNIFEQERHEYEEKILPLQIKLNKHKSDYFSNLKRIQKEQPNLKIYIVKRNNGKLVGVYSNKDKACKNCTIEEIEITNLKLSLLLLIDR